jgi:GTPase
MEVAIPKNLISTLKTPEKAILIAVKSNITDNRWPVEDSVNELAALANSAGASVVGKIIQKISRPSTTQYLGKGKVEELLAQKENLGFDTVIVDDELTPQQQENLEDMLQTKVIDRIALILDIFAKRARTHEGKLQVELAQYEYNLPRLAGKWRHLERLGAGIGTRGPGESQLETDKRLIRQKITRLKKQLEDVRQQRSLYRQKRQRTGIPVVALVGYTNSGKSTLMNSISKSDVLAKDELFSTLDTTTRRLVLPDKKVVLLSDTVGFIRKLPPTLLAAFRATLEELNEANILIHVVDMTSQKAVEQCDTVVDILKKLDLADKPRITALNKIDLLLENGKKWDEETALHHIADKCGIPGPNTILISASKKWGFAGLLELISQLLSQKSPPEPQPIPHDDNPKIIPGD